MGSLFSLAYFLLAVGLHAGLARLNPSGNRVRQFLLVGLPTGILLLAHLSLRPDFTWPALFASGLAFAFACELYVFLFTFVISSISAALLVARLDGKNYTAAIIPDLPPAEMVTRRLDGMVAAGFLAREGDRFSLTAKARFTVRINRMLRQFFRHPIAPLQSR